MHLNLGELGNISLIGTVYGGLVLSQVGITPVRLVASGLPMCWNGGNLERAGSG
jgi:hypothetical protein